MQAQASQLAAALEHAVLKYLCFQARLPAGLACSSAPCRLTVPRRGLPAGEQQAGAPDVADIREGHEPSC